MKGWMGKILRVDLSDREVNVEKLNEENAELYIGARGLGSKILFDEIDPQIDPLSPENKLIFASGPLTGTLAAASGRYDVITKAPLTKTIAASNSGGYFGQMLKRTGFDVLIIEGKSDKPAYLWIENETVEIRNAEHFWGGTTSETEEGIIEETNPEAEVACIGPAGEREVLFSCIINDKSRAAGRSGVGAVMGSKNLKAIAVYGEEGIKVSNPGEFLAAVGRATDKIKENDVTKGLGLFGTAMLVNAINGIGGFPSSNHRSSIFEKADKISGETLKNTLLVRNRGCSGCTIGCGRVTEVRGGKYAGFGEGPEYEAIWAMGSECDIDDLEAISKANFMANDLGYDPISFGVTLACAMELCESGYMPEGDRDMELRFGDADALVEAARKVGYRDGVGDLLALGSLRLAERYGHKELSMSTKGQEFPAYDPRVFQGMALEYATSNRGGCHVRGYTIAMEVVGVPYKLEPLETEGKASGVKLMQDFTAAIDASGTCLFTSFAMDVKDLADELKHATGVDYDEKKLLECGERIWNLERLFNLKAGFTSDDDNLPPRMLNDPVADGPARGAVAKLSTMLGEYYSLRGWNERGIPKNRTLERLGLAEVQ